MRRVYSQHLAHHAGVPKRARRASEIRPASQRTLRSRIGGRGRSSGHRSSRCGGRSLAADNHLCPSLRKRDPCRCAQALPFHEEALPEDSRPYFKAALEECLKAHCRHLSRHHVIIGDVGGFSGCPLPEVSAGRSPAAQMTEAPFAREAAR